MADAELPSGEKPKKKGIIKYIILLVILLLLGGGGYFAYTQFFAGGDDAAQSEAGDGGGEGGEATPEEDIGPTEMVTLPTFLVNLADPLGRRYLKLTVDVEVAGTEAVDELNQNQAKVRDAIILLLSSKTYNDLNSLEAKILLKKEIVERLNLVLGGPKVVRVYFTEMVIQ